MIRLAERQNMKSARICDLVSARFFPGSAETMKPNCVKTRLGETISRVKVVATAVEKFVAEDGRFASISVDDGTGAIQARVFSDNLGILERVDLGDLVSIVGKMRNYNGENYISPDFLRRLDDPDYESFFKLELLRNLFGKKKIADDVRNMREQMSEDELKEYAAERYSIDSETLQIMLQSKDAQIDYRPAVLDAMDRLDQGDGVEIGKLLEASKIDESMAESAINELLASGDVYEPVAGRLRRVRA